ncbi:ABC transporter substrate-binding protein, partial [Streptococcus pneumoniae]|nr:ABC transporter substrate-binding protein [Streptococcus pneumoniae]
EDSKVFNFKFEEGVKWHNGEELTVNDWVFALETIADPDYDGPRYANVQTIEGAEAYRSGDADSISGIEVVSDYEVNITFDEARVNNLTNLGA